MKKYLVTWSQVKTFETVLEHDRMSFDDAIELIHDVNVDMYDELPDGTIEIERQNIVENLIELEQNRRKTRFLESSYNELKKKTACDVSREFRHYDVFVKVSVKRREKMLGYVLEMTATYNDGVHAVVLSQESHKFLRYKHAAAMMERQCTMLKDAGLADC